ncbi:hypothetical protein LshimejAT787_0405940 [Lyophyllum shimeji]|uniref:Uncharacterized protein n=1 Tax=Lyophyllum shimeji TaxID=47721 RepID=A0A9P3PKF6_LYOSH|nr:hypothetical protein LshimejAT787_0405940 [Lyophyllum shimeji]
MYHNAVASSSRSTTHEPWSPPSGDSSFPTSDLRSTPLQPTTPPPTRVPPHFLAPSPAPCSDLTPSNCSTPVPVWKEIEPGVWSDGTDRVLSAAYPPVRQFIATARRSMSLPVPPSDVVFVIAALEVFYRRNDPVHWMFWSDEKKYETAKVVNRIALRSPQLIRSKVAWNGISEYLFILSGLHGASSLPTDKEWFHVLNPSKAPSPPMNLRKRKVQQVEQADFLDLPEEDNESEVGERRRKRSKVKATRHVKPSTPATAESAKGHSNDAISSQASPASTSTSLPADEPNTPDTSSPCDPARDERPTPSTENSVPVQAKLSRQKPKARQSPDPSTLPRATSPTPITGSITPPSAISHSRNRSTSRASSSQTLVSANERRSVSVLSNITAVEVRTVGDGADDRAIKVDQSESDSEEAGKAEDESRSGMVTRGRANQARAAGAQGKGASRPSKPRAKRRAAK